MAMAASKEEEEEQEQVSEVRDFFHQKPKNLMDEHLVDKNNKEAQLELFNHFTNCTAQLM